MFSRSMEWSFRIPEPPIVVGSGEWDPPGGWRPFSVFASNGESASAEHLIFTVGRRADLVLGDYDDWRWSLVRSRLRSRRRRKGWTMFEYHGWATLRLTPGSEEVPDGLLERFAEQLRGAIAERFGTGSGIHEVRAVNGEYHVLVDGSPNHRDERIFGLFPYIAARAPGSYGLLYVWDDDHPVHENAFRVWRLVRGRVEELSDALLSPCTPVLEDAFRDEDETTALERDTADFIVARNVELPGLRVLRVARDALLAHARHHGLLHAGLDFEALARTLQPPHDKQSLLASVFLDLWSCANFISEIWSPLIEMDPAMAGLAVEACYFIFAFSGADGESELRELLDLHHRWDAVDSVEFAALDHHARRWLTALADRNVPRI